MSEQRPHPIRRSRARFAGPAEALAEVAASSPENPEQPVGPPVEAGAGPAGAGSSGTPDGGQLVHRHGPGHLHRAGGGRPDQRVHQHHRAARLGQPVLGARPRVRAAWDTAVGAYVALFEGSIFNPHTVSALFQQASISTADPRRLPQRGVLPAVRDLRPGHAADPGRARGRAAVPGGPVQHRRAEPVHRRRDRRHLPRLRRQPAGRHPRGRLRDRRFRGRRGDRLARRRAQGADRRARGDRHDHAQLHHGLFPGLPALLPLPDAGAEDRQPDHRGHRRATRTCRCCSARTCASTRAS